MFLAGGGGGEGLRVIGIYLCIGVIKSDLGSFNGICTLVKKV